MRTWIAKRYAAGSVILFEEDGQRRETISPRESQRHYNHSPDGFEFGYGGSGPAQLALAIMLRYFRDDPRLALREYQAFKWCFVAGVTGERLVISEADVDDWFGDDSARAEAES